MVSSPNNYYRTSSSDRARLRIGLLLDSLDGIPAFFARCIEDIKASNFAGIELVVVRKNPAGDALQGAQPTKRNPLLYDLYLRLDSRLKPADDPLAKVDYETMLAGIETLEVEVSESENQFPAAALEKIRSKDLDVLIQWEFKTLPDEILKAARYGVWTYHLADAEFYRGGPSHFWELRERAPISGVTLVARTGERRDGIALCKSLFATESTISVSRNRYAPDWGSADLIIRKLHELHQFGWNYVLENAIPPAPYQGKREIYTAPSNGEMLRWLGPILLKKAITRPFRRKTVQHWRIASRVLGKPLYESESESDFSGFQWLSAPQGHCSADPFPFEHEGKCWLFFEDYSYRENRGSLACSEVSSQGELGPPVICLDHPSHHYSYPHVFRAGAEVFMIPESYDSGSVDLFRCRQFPDRWVREASLFSGKFVDTTVWEHEGLWWLMTTSAERTVGAGSLLLFYSSSLTGEWQYHPANPMSTDIRTNRGAGRIIRDKGRLIRPSQSCAPTYGYSIAFSEITELSKQRYAERLLKTITPEHWKGLAGVHTYNCAGGFEFIDGRAPLPLKHGLLSK